MIRTIAPAKLNLTLEILGRRDDGYHEIRLQCGDCRERNYTSTKNRRNDPNRLELRKYCSRCRGHTAHREVR